MTTPGKTKKKETDIYELDKRIVADKRRLLADTEVTERNKELILEFDDHKSIHNNIV